MFRFYVMELFSFMASVVLVLSILLILKIKSHCREGKIFCGKSSIFYIEYFMIKNRKRKIGFVIGMG